jgi:serine/threonine protein kinase
MQKPSFAVRPLSLPPYRGEIAESYSVPEYLSLLSDPRMLLSAPETEILLDGRNKVAAVKVTPIGRPPAVIVVKSFGARGLSRLKTLVQPSKAAKAWRGAVALIESGFRTAAPIAYLERRSGGLVRESYFVAEHLPGGREIRFLFRELPPVELESLLAALAGELVRVHAAGLLHRDLSDGNILVENDGGAFRFFFLDTNRVRRRARLGSLARAKNLVRLGVPPGLRAHFLECYAAAAGGPLRPGFALRYRAAKAAFSGWIGLKKKLRLKTLARKLKIQ